MRYMVIPLLFLAGLIASAPIVRAQDAPKNLDAIVEMLVSDDVSVRREARVLLEDYLDGLAAGQREQEIGGLCARLWTSDYRYQLGLALALSQLGTPWQSSRHEEDVQKLYALMQQSKDDTLQRYLDDALANAKGLYFDAINDYNNIDERNPDGEIGRIPEVRAKFQRMAGFSDSVYAGNAVFYLGQYLARMATIFGRRDEGLNDSLLGESTKVFGDYIDRAANGAFRRATFMYDAYFYRALNQVIAGQPEQAVRLLKQVPDTPDDRIYVYQFFYSRDRDTVIDRTIDGGRLVDRMIRHIQKFGNEAIERQSELVRAVRNVKAF